MNLALGPDCSVGGYLNQHNIISVVFHILVAFRHQKTDDVDMLPYLLQYSCHHDPAPKGKSDDMMTLPSFLVLVFLGHHSLLLQS